MRKMGMYVERRDPLQDLEFISFCEDTEWSGFLTRWGLAWTYAIAMDDGQAESGEKILTKPALSLLGRNNPIAVVSELDFSGLQIVPCSNIVMGTNDEAGVSTSGCSMRTHDQRTAASSSIAHPPDHTLSVVHG
jgi:hypothetical protein